MAATAEIRALLERTGHLYTQDPQDVGHISEFWRKRIAELCDLLDSAPLGIAAVLRAEREAHKATRLSLSEARAWAEVLEQRLAAKANDVERALEKHSAAVRLVEEAVPRMQTLNNAMSPDWLRRAAEFLGE